MIFRDLRTTRLGLQIIDGLCATGAMILAYLVRIQFLPRFIPLESHEIGQLSVYLPYAILMGLLAPIILERRGIYRHFSIRKRGGVFSSMMEVSLVLFLLAVSLIFFLKESPSRVVFVLFIPIYSFMLSVREELFRRLSHSRRQAGQYSANLILISDSETSAERWSNLFADSATAVRVAHLLHLSLIHI